MLMKHTKCAALLTIMGAISLQTSCKCSEERTPEGKMETQRDENQDAGNVSELKIVTLKEGAPEAAMAQKGSVVEVHYRGYLDDGKEFDSSYNRDEPFVFELGTGKVIKGWDQGIDGMRVGEKRKLIIPANLAYGKRGLGQIIPPNSTLTFEVELLATQ